MSEGRNNVRSISLLFSEIKRSWGSLAFIAFPFCFFAFCLSSLKINTALSWACNTPVPPTPASPKPAADCVHGAGVARRSGMPTTAQPAGCCFSRNAKIRLSSVLRTGIYSLGRAHPAVLTQGTWVQPGESPNRAPPCQRCADPRSIHPQNSTNNVFFLHYLVVLSASQRIEPGALGKTRIWAGLSC